MKVHSNKLAGYVICAFLAYFALTHPTQAADIVRTVASGVAQFASALSGGGQ